MKAGEVLIIGIIAIMTERVDAVVIGAGVVGLACARELALAGLETVIIEAEDGIGTGTSSRNSEVIHAGIYYPTGSLKARLCVAGRQMLYRYCEERGVQARRCGKLIVATNATQVDELDRLIAKARANGVDDLYRIDAAAARRLEPELACVAAVVSPSTGIVDSHALMLSYLGDAERAGAMLALKSRVERAYRTGDGWLLAVAGEVPTELLAGVVVNSAGLAAPAVAGRFAGLHAEHVPRAWFAKGNYFSLIGRAPFSRLVYPVPEAAGLGVHLTIDLGGQARFGPDVQWLAADEPAQTGPYDYSVDPRRADSFYSEIRKYWPALKDGALAPGYAGIRPKLQAPGEAAGDFVLSGPAEHGAAGLVNLFGIESPGLTASLAIAEQVARMLQH
jgi:L-2-hydroxyglutarate oxidase LhgO